MQKGKVLMKEFFDKEIQSLLLLVIMLISVQVPLYFLQAEGKVGLLLSVFLLILVSISLLAGPVVGLFSSLVFIFMIGSFLFYIALASPAMALNTGTIPLHVLLGYGFALIILVMIAGQIHNRTIEQGKIKRKLQEEVRQFVAVDVDTGFDNKYRMALEVDAEMKRINRYGGTFTLILLQLDYYEDFTRLYGEKEKKHLLHSLAEKMQNTIRSTDRKFRYDADRFALLLTNTDGKSIEIIYAKIAESLKVHQLLNEKYITLSFRTGHIVYNEEVNVKDYETLFSQVESEMITREL